MRFFLILIFCTFVLPLSSSAEDACYCPQGYSAVNGQCQKTPSCPVDTIYNPVTNLCEGSGAAPYACTITPTSDLTSTAGPFGLVSYADGTIAIKYNGITGNAIALKQNGTSSATYGEHTVRLQVLDGSVRMTSSYINYLGSSSSGTGILINLATPLLTYSSPSYFPHVGSRSVDPSATVPYIRISESTGIAIGKVDLVNAAISESTRVDGSYIPITYTCNAGDTRNGLTCSSVTESQPDCTNGTLDINTDLCIATCQAVGGMTVEQYNDLYNIFFASGLLAVFGLGAIKGGQV